MKWLKMFKAAKSVNQSCKVAIQKGEGVRVKAGFTWDPRAYQWEPGSFLKSYHFF